MMKQMAEIAPVAAILSAIGAMAIAFYAGAATTEHNKQTQAHPIITQSIQKNQAKIDSQGKVWQVIQTKNESDHTNLAHTQERMILILDRLEVKITRVLEHRQ